MDRLLHRINLRCLIFTVILGLSCAGYADAHRASQSANAPIAECAATPLALDAVLALFPQHASSSSNEGRQGESDRFPVATPSSYVDMDSRTTVTRLGETLVLVQGRLSPSVAVARDANQAEKVAALSAINHYMACLDAGEFFRAFALVTPSHLRAILTNWQNSYSREEIAAALAAPPLAVQDNHRRLFTMDDFHVRLLVHGRLFVRGTTAVLILEKLDGDYRIAEGGSEKTVCPACRLAIVPDDPTLVIPDPLPAFISLITTPTETNPNPILVTVHEAYLYPEPKFALDSDEWDLARGARLSVTGKPVRKANGIFIPIRVDERMGYVDARIVVPYTE